MRIIGKRELDNYKNDHAEVRRRVDAWMNEVEEVTWTCPSDIKKCYPKSSILGNNNVIFDFGWNKYRLWTIVDYKLQIVLIKKIGTHKEYSSWLIA